MNGAAWITIGILAESHVELDRSLHVAVLIEVETLCEFFNAAERIVGIHEEGIYTDTVDGTCVVGKTCETS